MIKITRESTNTVDVTLSEKTTVSPATYLFSISKENNVVVKNFIAADTSSYPNRYNRFSIVEVGASGTEDLNNGQVQFNTPGLYQYVIYAQTSTTNLDPTLADEEVEKGIFKVLGSENTFTTYNSNSKTVITYKPS